MQHGHLEPSRAGRGGLPIDGDASWSRDGRLIAQVASGGLRVFSQDRTFGRQTVSDADGNPYRVAVQLGNRWLDDRRLILWDLDLGNAFLWDTDTQTATRIEGIDELGEFTYSEDGEEFVFSEDGRTLFRLRTTVDSDIWLLELSH